MNRFKISFYPLIYEDFDKNPLIDSGLRALKNKCETKTDPEINLSV